MNKTICVQGDSNSRGGILGKSLINFKITINGLPIAVVGDPVSPHGDPPQPAIAVANTINPPVKVFIDGIPIIREGESDSSGYKRLKSSSNFKIFSE